VGIVLGIAQVAVSLLLAALSIPLIRDAIPMNDWYGVRIKKSFQSGELWYKINNYGGRQLMIGAAIILIMGVMDIVFGALLVGIPDGLWLALYCAELAVGLGIPVARIMRYAEKL
jgi:ABC-type phosphate transport system permease subunit